MEDDMDTSTALFIDLFWIGSGIFFFNSDDEAEYREIIALQPRSHTI
jgi:hypothetical protein